MSGIKIIAMFLVGIMMLGSVVYLYEKGVNGGCEKEFNVYKEYHPVEDYGSWSCGYDLFSILILMIGSALLLFIGVFWEEGYS